MIQHVFNTITPPEQFLADLEAGHADQAQLLGFLPVAVQLREFTYIAEGRLQFCSIQANAGTDVQQHLLVADIQPACPLGAHDLNNPGA